MLTSEQIRAAMAVLRWTRKELAEKAGVGWATVQRIAEGTGTPRSIARNLEAVQGALEEGNQTHAIKFVDDVPVGIRIIEKG